MFQDKFIVKTWQELSSSVAGDSNLSFKPTKKLPKKVQQGGHSYKSSKGWFNRDRVANSPVLSDNSGNGELSRGFFIYDVENSTSYAAYPSQSFMDDMVDMVGSQSFSSDAFAQMSESFTNVTWPDYVVIQETYATTSAVPSIGWDRVGVMLSSSNWSTQQASASVKFINSSTNDIGMLNSFNVLQSSKTFGNYATASHLYPFVEYTLPVTTASYNIINTMGGGAFSCSFHLTSLESPGYTASDGTINTGYSQTELAESMEWRYTGSYLYNESPIGKGVGFADASKNFDVYDHSGSEMGVAVTEQEIKTKIFSDNPNEVPTNHPSTIAIFSTFGGTFGNITSSVCKRYAYSDVSASGAFDNVTIYYVTRGTETLALGHTSGLGSHMFADSNLITAAIPGVYKDFIPTTGLPAGAFITTQTSSMSQLIRFSGSAT